MCRLVGDEDGSATVVGVAVVACLVAVTIALAHVGTAVLARHRAASAADLSALAAASVLLGGSADPCATATRIVRAQGYSQMRIDSCVIDGEDVVVEVALPVGLGRFGVRTARARARAGPVGS
nr:Rv3654c family TadE-like protein [Gordonia araii]